MIIVKKENVVYKINESEKKDYLKKGYVVIDETGKIVETETKENEDYKLIEKLNEQVKELTEKANDLTVENATLTSEKEALENQVKELTEKAKKAKKDSE